VLPGRSSFHYSTEKRRRTLFPENSDVGVVRVRTMHRPRSFTKGTTQYSSHDWKLLCFERMRVIDMAHYWALDTHNKYQSKIRAARRFEQQFGFRLLDLCTLSSPSVSMEIPLMWLHEAYSLRLSHRRDPEGQHLTLAMDTIRQLRSAASQFLSWELMVSRPSGVSMDLQQRILEAPCRSSGSLAFTLFMKGMSA
jgi:hypothetical protein